jgi:hypothetical protein
MRQLCALAIEMHIPVHVLELEDERVIATYLDIFEDRAIEAKLDEQQARRGSNGS